MNTSKTFANVYNGRTHAQVVSKITYQPHGQHVNQGYNKKGTHIVTFHQGNAKADFVTSSKISIKSKPSKPMGALSLSGLKPKAVVKQSFDQSSVVFQVPINNRFKILEGSQEHLLETTKDASMGQDGMVTASAVPTMKYKTVPTKIKQGQKV